MQSCHEAVRHSISLGRSCCRGSFCNHHSAAAAPHRSQDTGAGILHPNGEARQPLTLPHNMGAQIVYQVVVQGRGRQAICRYSSVLTERPVHISAGRPESLTPVAPWYCPKQVPKENCFCVQQTFSAIAFLLSSCDKVTSQLCVPKLCYCR